MPLVDVARIETSQGLIKSEVFNLTKFSPQYQRISTRFKVNSYLIKLKPPQKLDYDAESYSPFVRKLALLPSYSFCTQTNAIS